MTEGESAPLLPTVDTVPYQYTDVNTTNPGE